MSVIEYRKRRAARLDKRRLDDDWITIKGTHVMVDDDKNVVKGPDALKSAKSKGQKSLKSAISSEMSPNRTDYAYEDGDDRDDWVHKNVDKLQALYDEGGSQAINDEWYKFRMADSTKGIHQISKDEADEAVYDSPYVTQSLYDGWFRNADSSYKPKLTNAIVSTPEMRNAALNLAYENYRQNTENPLGFREFLVTPIKVYRGEQGQKHIKDDVFDAYTFDKKTAEHFAGPNGNIIETEVRPIDTYGSMRAVGEAEIWVPRKLSPVGRTDEEDVKRTGDWEWKDPIKWAFEDRQLEAEQGFSEPEFSIDEDALDSIIRDAEMIELFASSKSEKDKEVAEEVVGRCVDSIQRSVMQMTAYQKAQNGDGAFFAGELDSDLGEKEKLYPDAVEAFRERRQKRLDAKTEEGRWVTTENNHKIHLNKEGEPDKGNPHVIGAIRGKDQGRSMKDFLPEKSYTDGPEYKEAVRRAKEARENNDKAWSRVKEIDKELEKESSPKPKGEWTDEDMIEDLIGRRPMSLTEKGKKLKEERKALFDDMREYDHAYSEAGDELRRLKRRAHDEEIKEYKPEPLVPAKSDDYEGFTLEKTSNSYGDEYLHNGLGVICEMSPREYLERCAYEIFDDATMESCLAAIDEGIAKGYAEKMKNGEKFDLPYLNYRQSGQEGRHRAYAAYLAGIDKMPVLLIGRPQRADAKEEPAAWITVRGNHIPIDEEGDPIGGQQKALGEGAEKKTAAESPGKKPPLSKSSINKMLNEIADSDMPDEEKVKAIKNEFPGLRPGTKIIMPESWNSDDGKPQMYTYDGMLWNDDNGWGGMSEEDMAYYFLDKDPNERPRIKSIPRDPDSVEASRKKREASKHYAMHPDGSINGKYTKDFHNDHVSREERNSFAKEIKDMVDYEKGWDPDRSLYRGEANRVGDRISAEIKRRAALRRGDKENAPINDQPQVEDIYDVLKDMRDFGPPEGFNPKINSDLPKERTDAIVKEALDRFPTDWLRDADSLPVINIIDGPGRAICLNKGYINVYTQKDLGLSSGEKTTLNDRALVNDLAHELGHYIEWSNQKVQYSARDCLWERGKDSEIVDVEPGYQGYKDSFFNTYMGKIYSHGGTEIISMLMGNIGCFQPFSVLEGHEYDYSKGKYDGRKKKDKESLGYILGVLAGL